MCENLFAYQSCGPVCPETCMSIVKQQRIEQCENSKCVEGCFCPPGYVQERKLILIKCDILIFDSNILPLLSWNIK